MHPPVDIEEDRALGQTARAPGRRAHFVQRLACIGCGDLRLITLSSGRFDEGALAGFIAEDPWGEDPAPYLAGRRWAYVRCSACDLTFHQYILDAQWNEHRFTHWMSQSAIESFVARQPADPARALDRAAERVAHALRIERLTRPLCGDAPARVLDFGCGYGEFLGACGEVGLQAFGVDRSSAKLEHGRFARVFASLDEARPHAPFHALTLFEVLEHLDQPYETLAELATLLVPGGTLVLETPDCSGVADIRSRDDYAKIHPLEHINGFTPATLSQFAQRLGFEPLRAPIACVAGDLRSLARTLRRQFARRARPVTQAYFRKQVHRETGVGRLLAKVTG